MRQSTSLRTQLTAWFTILLVSFGLMGGLGAYIAAQQDPDNFLDDQMREIALDVVGSADDLAQMPAPPLETDDMIVVQAWNADGHLLKSFPPEVDLPRQRETGFASFDTPEGGWRSYTWVLDDGTVQVSQRTVVRRELALKAALPAIITCLLLVPMSWLLVRWVVGRILGPLDGLTRQLLTRQPDSTQRLAALDVPGEIVPLVGAMDEALGRVRDTLAAQRRFVSHAAHQLRTPLTALRIQARNLRQLSNGAVVLEILDDLDLGIRRMSALTGQLLTLARAEAPLPAEAPALVLLADVLQEAIAGIIPFAQSRDITLAPLPLSLIQIPAERHDVVMLLSNLLDNAVRYTPAGGQVEFATQSAENRVMVEIADTGPGIPDEMLTRVFDPFVRGAHEQDGTGLGLSIVKALAIRIGAQVSLQNKPDGHGLVVRVALPACPEPDVSDRHAGDAPYRNGRAPGSKT
jgi:two-component system OmpR family sensor kinase